MTANTASSEANAPRYCPLCKGPREASERNSIPSNVRRFRHETFAMWRCGECQSLHARDDVDLEHYYSGYPIFAANLDWKLRVVYDSMLKRLRAAALSPEHSVLDYGCGSGLLVQHLQDRGYNAVGYDRFAAGMNRPELLSGTYDAVVSQDVIEHVDDPHALLEEFDRMVRPGGFIAVGTPDAAALDLQNFDNDVHALHQPYHRHILSKQALHAAGQARGWVIEQHYDTMFNNTPVPLLNPRFVLHYVKSQDDTFDLVAETPQLKGWKIWSPATPFFALFGYFFDRHTDIMTVFRKPSA